MHCSKNPWTKGFELFEFWGPQNTGMNLGAFLSRTQRFKALQKKLKKVIPHMIWDDTWITLIRCRSWGRMSPESHLSTLQVPPHGSLAPDGQASVVQHTQEEQHQAKNQASRHTQCYTCDLTTAQWSGERDDGVGQRFRLSWFVKNQHN